MMESRMSKIGLVKEGGWRKEETKKRRINDVLIDKVSVQELYTV